MIRGALWFVLGMLFVAATSLAARADPPVRSTTRGEMVSQGAKASVVKAFSTSPLRFEANKGQAGQGVKFLSRGKGYSLHLSPTGATFTLRKRVKTEGAKPGILETAQRHPPRNLRRRARSTGFEIKTSTIKIGFAGANPQPGMIGEDKLVSKTNYQVGDDPAKWQLGVANYAKVRYADIYPGIDLVYYGNQRQVEYDFIVQPGADPRVIRLAFSGMESIAVEAGNLVLQTPYGPLIQQAPIVYQEIDGRRVKVAGTYALLDGN